MKSKPSSVIVSEYATIPEKEEAAMRRRYSKPTALLLLALGLFACNDRSEPTLQTGPWRAWLVSPGGEVPFELTIAREHGELSSTIRNGEELVEVPRTYWDGRELILEFEHYGSRIRALVDETGSRLDGAWTRSHGAGFRLTFHAEAGSAPRFPTAGQTGDTSSFPSRWHAEFERSDWPAVALLNADADGTVEGTFLLVAGDKRFLAGRLDGDHLRLSRFDGAIAYLFEATLGPDGALQGDFWEGDYYHERWSARPDEGAELPDSFGLLSWSGPVDLEGLSLADLAGQPRTLAEPEFLGKGLVIEILGTWCPNCQDASIFLMDLLDRYGERGLKVVAVAFEPDDDFERNAERVRVYRDLHGIDYPVLLATGEAATSPSHLFPTIQGEFGFPSLLFLRPDGSVFRTHTGFAGPATGNEYVQLREELESVVEQMLSDAPA